MEQSRGFYSGISGLQTPLPKRDFPPEHQDKSRLGYYATIFNSIEINSSFYKIPVAKTIAKWTTEVPDSFRFTFKLWQGITHNKALTFDPGDVFKFMQVIGSTIAKKGCLLVQFPPSTSVSAMKQLEFLLRTLCQANAGDWQLAIEFRNRSWYLDEVYELLREHHAGMVLHDLPASAAPLIETALDFIYLRFHGPNGGYRGSYPDEFLSEHATYIHDWQQDGKEIYAYFNNTMGAALANLIMLNGFVNNGSFY